MLQQLGNTFDNQAGADKRQARRMRVLMSGNILLPGNLSTFPCTVRNLSEGGAMIVFPDLTPVPEHFSLHVELSGFKVECEKIWQDGLTYGVRFLSEREPVKSLRQQLVNTSETALSQQTRRDFEIRERLAEDERRIAEERAAERRREMAEAVSAGRRAALLGIANGKFGKRS
jgi:hypothetical protein